METIREKILKQIKASLEQISVANHYNTDLGNYVIRGQAVGPISALPATIIQAMPDEQTEFEHGSEKNIMPVLITGNMEYVLLTDYETEKDGIAQLAEMILGDIKLAIGNALLHENIKYIDAMSYQGGGAESYPDLKEGELAVQVIIRYDVKYSTKVYNPYEQNY